MSDAASRLNAALEGRYRIERELGEGGMATVYLARDERHNRPVALKVLKPELAAVVGAERFLAEIETTANLQHPHILPLHDSGEADGFLFYVMPYIEGETLRDRLEREKQLPVDEAVRIATDVAEALHSAHEQGVIHRDIKPANILMSQGRPLVADFGIALAVSAAGGGRLTETGLSMGTPYYMSPEQASADREPSAASDVYSLGCVLYEMLVGDPPYVGSSAQAVLAKILMGDAPTPTATRASIPANVDAAIRKALEKLPADRFRSVQDFAKALGDAGFRHGHGRQGEGAPFGSATSAGPWNPLTSVFAALAVVFALTSVWAMLRPEAPQGVMRYSLAWTGAGAAELVLDVALSPDGTAIVYRDSTSATLLLKETDQAVGVALSGTEGAMAPFFSPDGEWVGFFQEGELRKIPARGGQSLPVADSANRTRPSGAWLDDGTIVFVDAGFDLRRVSAGGGPAEPLKGSQSFGFEGGIASALQLEVRGLPEAAGVLFSGCTAQCAEASVYVHVFERGEYELVFPDARLATLLPTGQVV